MLIDINELNEYKIFQKKILIILIIINNNFFIKFMH